MCFFLTIDSLYLPGTLQKHWFLWFLIWRLLMPQSLISSWWNHVLVHRWSGHIATIVLGDLNRCWFIRQGYFYNLLFLSNYSSLGERMNWPGRTKQRDKCGFLIYSFGYLVGMARCFIWAIYFFTQMFDNSLIPYFDTTLNTAWSSFLGIVTKAK